MVSVWTDYPIFGILSIWVCLLILYTYYMKTLNRRRHFPVNFPIWLSVLGCFIIVAVFLMAMRQSFGTFPIQTHDAMVSKNKAINFLPINGVFALKTSFEERGKSENLGKSALSRLSELGYENPAKAARDYFDDEKLSLTLSDSAALEKLFQVTPTSKFLEKNKPNVVFIFMESMSNYNMNFDSEQMNLLGSLRKHFKSDLLFRNFVSSDNATIQSLEYLLINTPISFTQSKYRFQSYPSAVALPFKSAGFENNFITGAEISWRNLNEFVPYQGFQSIVGKQDILSRIKNSKANHWGVYDEFLFDYVFEKLSAKNTKPKFMFVQTTTNHTPFDLPQTYKPNEISLTKDVKKRLLVSEDIAIKNLNCFQYSNNCLGTFLDKIKNSELSKNTIVVMTGDHNNLMLFDFDEAHQLQQRRVPLYIHVPGKYKPTNAVNTSIFGSHKDIFPTIYNIALSNTRYYSIGNNLLESADENQDKYFGMNIGSNTAFSKNASVNYSSIATLYKMTKAQELIQDDSNLSAKDLLKRSRANYALSMFYILNSIKQPPADNVLPKTKIIAQRP